MYVGVLVAKCTQQSVCIDLFPSGKRIQITSCNHFKKTKTPFTQAQQHFVYF